MTCFDKVMQRALYADGEKLHALTGQHHGPQFGYSILDDFAEWRTDHGRACMCGSFNVRVCRAAPNGIEAERYVCDDCCTDWLEDAP